MTTEKIKAIIDGVLLEREKHKGEEVRNKNCAPQPVFWETTIGYDGEQVGEMPICPACGEPAFDLVDERCMWCGQQIVIDEHLTEYNKPNPIEYMDCLFCEGKNSMRIQRNKYNGHKRGCCEKCGKIIIE